MKKFHFVLIICIALFMSDAEAKKKKEKSSKKEAKTELTENKGEKSVAKKTIRCKRTRATGTRMSSQICADKKTRKQMREDSQDYMRRGAEVPAQIPGVSGG